MWSDDYEGNGNAGGNSDGYEGDWTGTSAAYEAPARGMSRYEFTRPGGYRVGTVEARTAMEAREAAESRFGRTDMLCTHLCDAPEPTGLDPIFYYGPDAVDRDA